MNGKNPLLLKLLLIAIMVLQPVGAAFSMSMMSHHLSAAFDMDHRAGMMEHDDRQHAGEQAAQLDHAGLNADADTDDCCASSAACPMASCGAVLFMNPISIPKTEMVSTYSSIDLSWGGVLLPTEIRPPRSHLG